MEISNKVFFALMALIMILSIGAGAYALTTAEFGHTATEIGTGTIAGTLTITTEGNVRIENGWRGLQIEGQGSNPHRYDFIVGELGADPLNYGGFAIFDHTANKYRFSINRDGKVGIGTATPRAKLEIDATGVSTTAGWLSGIHFTSPLQSAITLKNPEAGKGGLLFGLHGIDQKFYFGHYEPDGTTWDKYVMTIDARSGDVAISGSLSAKLKYSGEYYCDSDGDLNGIGSDLDWPNLVQMIHKDKGFCYLLSVRGAFNGWGEIIQIYLNDDNGYWYMDCGSGSGDGTRGIARCVGIV